MIVETLQDLNLSLRNMINRRLTHKTKCFFISRVDGLEKPQKFVLPNSYLIGSEERPQRILADTSVS